VVCWVSLVCPFRVCYLYAMHGADAVFQSRTHLASHFLSLSTGQTSTLLNQCWLPLRHTLLVSMVVAVSQRGPSSPLCMHIAHSTDISSHWLSFRMGSGTHALKLPCYQHSLHAFLALLSIVFPPCFIDVCDYFERACCTACAWACFLVFREPACLRDSRMSSCSHLQRS
jgi:hypothetical protein